MPTTRQGLRSKLRTAFLWQASAIAIVAMLSVIAATILMREVLVHRALTEEVAYLRERLATDPGAALPDTARLDVWYARSPEERAAFPDWLQALPPGYHPHVPPGSDVEYLVLVDVGADGSTIAAAFHPEVVDRLAWWLGVSPLAIMLIAMWVLAWLAYRATRRAVAPLVWLAEVVQRWDPMRPETSVLHPRNLPEGVEGESRVLANSLHDYASRIGAFIDRERDFTRDASHELRTPLAVIRVAGDMMSADAGLSPMARRALARIQGAGRDMEALIEAFLILAREGDTGLPDDDFAVGDILDEEVQKARVMLGAKPVALELVKDTDFHLRAPARVLAVIVANLLRNAVQHTDEGSITVSLKPGLVTIADTGVGMSAEELSHAFDAAWHSLGGHGRGLGLSLVRRLSGRYGWQVGLQSTPGEGTVATLAFPEKQK
ncbi:sensor histidine kinase [Arenimonas composti]|uniref:histidine kinase n=1 Tax=Arenimonas composti TR7-09 = DSM 18010 TaxID=1121013 RepID=A0A091BBX8_9GAMM|nr:HAMP domain-containing sensor histidine kinase [Arenimonas composti]KFN49266.1 hypothetical protein P873_11505 [Arenimonas composti TR7-09 = DSM 18010]